MGRGKGEGRGGGEGRREGREGGKGGEGRGKEKGWEGREMEGREEGTGRGPQFKKNDPPSSDGWLRAWPIIVLGALGPPHFFLNRARFRVNPALLTHRVIRPAIAQGVLWSRPKVARNI